MVLLSQFSPCVLLHKGHRHRWRQLHQCVSNLENWPVASVVIIQGPGTCECALMTVTRLKLELNLAPEA